MRKAWSISIPERRNGAAAGAGILAAYDKGELGKAAALIKASEVSTGAAKNISLPASFQVPGNTIHLTPDDVVVKDGHPYTAGGGASPADTRIPVIRMRC